MYASDESVSEQSDEQESCQKKPWQNHTLQSLRYFALCAQCAQNKIEGAGTAKPRW
jgi:hypothetical protein